MLLIYEFWGFTLGIEQRSRSLGENEGGTQEMALSRLFQLG